MASIDLPISDDNSFIFNPFEQNMDSCGIYDSFFNPDVNQPNLNLLQLSCSEGQVNSLHQNINFSKNLFSTFHWNIRSMSKNHEELKTFLSTLSFSFSVLAFSETWLTDDVFTLFPLPNYVTFHSCRKN